MPNSGGSVDFIKVSGIGLTPPAVEYAALRAENPARLPDNALSTVLCLANAGVTRRVQPENTLAGNTCTLGKPLHPNYSPHPTEKPDRRVVALRKFLPSN